MQPDRNTITDINKAEPALLNILKNLPTIFDPPLFIDKFIYRGRSRIAAAAFNGKIKHGRQKSPTFYISRLSTHKSDCSIKP